MSTKFKHFTGETRFEQRRVELQEVELLLKHRQKDRQMQRRRQKRLAKRDREEQL